MEITQKEIDLQKENWEHFNDGESFEEWMESYKKYKQQNKIEVTEKVILNLEQFNNLKKILEVNSKDTGMSHWLLSKQMENLEILFEMEKPIEEVQMARSMHDIGMDFRALNELINDIEYDKETGEIINNDETLQEIADSIKGELSDKLDNFQYIYEELTAQEKALKEKAKKMVNRANAFGNRANLLKSLALGAIQASGETKIKTLEHSFTLTNSISLNVINEEEIPREYKKVKFEVDKTKATNELKSLAIGNVYKHKRKKFEVEVVELDDSVSFMDRETGEVEEVSIEAFNKAFSFVSGTTKIKGCDLQTKTNLTVRS